MRRRRTVEHYRGSLFHLDSRSIVAEPLAYASVSSRRARSFIRPAMVSSTSQPKKWAIFVAAGTEGNRS
jgi:hypothetical protein